MMKKYLLLITLVCMLSAATPVSIQDPDSEQYVKVDSSGAMVTSNFMLEVAKGNISGHSRVNKFGQNPATTTGEDVWAGGGVYTFYPETAQVIEVISTQAADDSGSTGAWIVGVYGLDSNWSQIADTVVLNGTTPVQLNKKFIRMYRGFVTSCGSSFTNAGNLIFRDTAESDTGVFVAAGDGQTQQAIYTVPAGKTAYFIKGYVSLMSPDKNGQDGTFQWLVRLNNGGVGNGAWLVKGQVGLVNIGSSFWVYRYGVPAGPIPEKADIRIKMSYASASFSTEAGFDLILVDN